MTKRTKLAVSFTAIGIVLITTIFFGLQSEESISLVGLSQPDQTYQHNQIASTHYDSAAENEEIRSDLPVAQLAQTERSITHRQPTRTRARDNAESPISPILDQVVSEVQLAQDTASYIQELEEMGLVTYLHGYKNRPVYSLLDGVTSNPDTLHGYFDKTAEELVELAQLGDATAMLGLANRAWAAGLWGEGDIYAFEAARIADSSEPLIHGAAQRLSQLGMGFQDPEGASWFLAAYLSGEIAAASNVTAYFRFMEPEYHAWAIERAYEILDELNSGG
ncbi:MAG: hypothetical protein AAF438_12870 [Pseudomonadota bacterium]